MEKPEPRRSGPLARPILTLFALIALAVLISLGVWQLQRLAWKQELIRRIEAVRTAPARPVESLLAQHAAGADVDYARAVADCPGLDAAPYVEVHAIEGGAPGVRVVSACPLDDAPYAAVLVDRGFVPEDALPVAPAPAHPAWKAHRPVVGVLRSPAPPNLFTPRGAEAGGRFYFRDTSAMSRRLGVNGSIAPVHLYLESPPPFRGGPTPSPVPTELSNRHLGYAITWFGLAAALVGVYAALMIKGRKPA